MAQKNKVKAFLKKLKALYVKYKQPVRGFLGWAGGLALQIVAQNGGYEKVADWDFNRWVTAMAVAAFPGVVAWMRGGDKNQTPEELAAAIAHLEAQREEQLRAQTAGK